MHFFVGLKYTLFIYRRARQTATPSFFDNMSQETILYAVIATAILLAIRWVWRELKRQNRGNVGCAGCPLADKCNSQKNGFCTSKELKLKKGK